jgi:hypothetical protein
MRRVLCTLGAVALCLLLCHAAFALDQAALDDLARLYTTDPVAACDKARQVFDDAFAREDVATMTAVLQVAAKGLDQFQYWIPLQEFSARAVPVALKAGDWEHLAYLYAQRPMYDSYKLESMLKQPQVGWWHVHRWRMRRLVHFVDLADAAATRVGKPRSDAFPPYMRDVYDAVKAGLPAYEEAVLPLELSGFGPDLSRIVQQVVEAAGVGDDELAIQRMAEALHRADPAQASGACFSVLVAASWLFELPGGEALADPVLQLARRLRRTSADLAGSTAIQIMDQAMMAWSGRDDAFLAATRELEPWVAKSGGYPPFGWAFMAQKAFLARRPAEATFVRRSYMDWIGQAGNRDSWSMGVLAAWGFVGPDTPVSERHLLIAWLCDAYCYQAAHGNPTTTPPRLAANLYAAAGRAPTGQLPEWTSEAADTMVATAPQWPDTTTRAAALEEAARMYEHGGQPVSAQRARDLAKALAAGDPKAALQCALTSARSLSSEGKWDEVVKALGPAVVKQSASAEVLQATLLLCEAHLRLGDSNEADRLMAKARELLDVLPLSPAERANYLLALAELCSVPGK